MCAHQPLEGVAGGFGRLLGAVPQAVQILLVMNDQLRGIPRPPEHKLALAFVVAELLVRTGCGTCSRQSSSSHGVPGSAKKASSDVLSCVCAASRSTPFRAKLIE